MKKPKVSVVMPVYNGEKYLAQAIKSILTQSLTNFEFIIIDDGSTDKTVSIVKKAADKRIKLLQNTSNMGLVVSLNKGIKAARGEYIARADGDDISLPNRLKLQVNFLDYHPDYCITGSNALMINQSGKKIGEIIVPEDNHSIKKNLIKRNNYLMHPTVMYRTKSVQKIDGYRMLFNPGAEDYDLWFRLINLGKFHNLQNNLVKRRFHDDVYSKKHHIRVEFMALIVRLLHLPVILPYLK